MTPSPRTSLRPPSWLSAQAPTAAIEIADGRVTVAEVGLGRDGVEVTAFASEALPDGVITPTLGGSSIADTTAVAAAVRHAWLKAGVRPPKRAALVIPDATARVTLLTFEELPVKAADVDQLIRWQVRKATPFPLEEAQVTYVVTHQEVGATTVVAIVARQDVIAEYEQVLTSMGTHPGIVDLASFCVVNSVLAGGAAPSGDWLLVTVARGSTALAIIRAGELMFYRHRLAVDDEPLGAFVHQTAMFHEDRLGGRKFARVWLSGGASVGDGVEGIGREISVRLGVEAEPVDVRVAVTLRDRISAAPDVLDALAAPVGVLLREGRGARS
ncbi:MAG: pilus assembly protein PilM [Acidobacteria bacterium]|nr:pilus assembly protein PilM [Acidobacteriota bacterium]